MEWKFFWSAFAVVCVLAASAKDRSSIGWFFLGVLLGPLALLILTCLPRAAHEPFSPEKSHLAGPARPPGMDVMPPRCRSCGDINSPDAATCRNCGVSLPPKARSMRPLALVLLAGLLAAPGALGVLPG